MTNQNYIFNNDRSFEEKRDLKRIELNTPTTVILPGSLQQINVICKNLSGNGICIESNQKFEINQQIEVFIKSASDKINSLHAMVTTTRCTVNPESNKFLISGKITNFC